MLARREDGYHELETLFQSVADADLLTLELTSGEIDLTVKGGAAPTGGANLATRAAKDFLRRWAPDVGVRIELDKSTPIGGGVGGGSSNAATVLLALRDLLGRPAQTADLNDLAAGLGADVPFFLLGGTALGRGRGDELTPLADLPERSIWLITPPVAISTAEMFGRLVVADLADRSPLFDDARLGKLDWDLVERGWNDFEETVMECYPVVRDVYNALVEGGATLVRLSGTGATMFAFFNQPPDICALSRRLPEGSRCIQTSTLNRSSLGKLGVV